ncbi:MAG: YHS domain-containing protein [Caldiserica bacterium]|nr:YHS domain-containing protein [Caldisericota bacterium]
MGEKGKDPVCGREVDKEGAIGSSEYRGNIFYFCSLGCKIEFDRAPAEYICQGKEGENGNYV